MNGKYLKLRLEINNQENQLLIQKKNKEDKMENIWEKMYVITNENFRRGSTNFF